MHVVKQTVDFWSLYNVNHGRQIFFSHYQSTESAADEHHWYIYQVTQFEMGDSQIYHECIFLTPQTLADVLVMGRAHIVDAIDVPPVP